MSDKKVDVYEQFAEKALSYLNGTEAFLKEQLPDYFQQIVEYSAIQSWVCIGFGTIFFIAFLCLTVWGIKEESKSYEKRATGCEAAIIIGGVLTTISLVSIGFSTRTLIKATIAPKVFIVDYLRGKE